MSVKIMYLFNNQRQVVYFFLLNRFQVGRALVLKIKSAPIIILHYFNLNLITVGYLRLPACCE